MKKLFSFSALSVFLCTTFGYAQNITHFAGNGTRSYFGDGGPASICALSNPVGICLDGAGNIYIGDETNNRIRMVNSSGIITTFAGTGASGYTGDGGPASGAQLYSPDMVITGPDGSLYFSDRFNNVIRKIDAAGVITTVAGNGYGAGGSGGFGGDGGPATAAKLFNPGGIALDTAGNLYIADILNSRIRKVNTSGMISTVVGTGYPAYGGDGGPATAADILNPQGICLDKAGNLYIADRANNRIRKVNTAGIISTVAGNGYGATTFTGGFAGDGGPAVSAELWAPTSVALDGNGNFYIADTYNNRIRKVNSAGKISTYAGSGAIGWMAGGYSGDGGPATAAKLNGPWNLAIGTNGKMYVSDILNNVIRVIDVPKTGVVENTVSAHISVYPNPGSGAITLNIATQTDDVADVSVINIAGQKVKQLKVNTNAANNIVLDVPAGLYYLHAATKTEQWTTPVSVMK